MDIGGFVAALEYCTGRPALVMGKPSADFFRVALGDIGASAHEVAMVGDDIDSDIGGAQRVGLFGILTRTGKFRQQYVEASSVRPDLVIDSIEALPDALVALQARAGE
jgi:ribonucleotide monophosphatase NagD (HAD superfamily)